MGSVAKNSGRDGIPLYKRANDRSPKNASLPELIQAG